MASEGYCVVPPDLRGHGLSSHDELGQHYNLTYFVAALDSSLSEKVRRRGTLVRHPLGSVISGLMTSLHQEQVEKRVMLETNLISNSTTALKNELKIDVQQKYIDSGNTDRAIQKKLSVITSLSEQISKSAD